MSKELIYYKPRAMRACVGPSFPGTETFAYYFKLYKAGAAPVDRTFNIKTPVNMKVLQPMPDFRPMTKSYEEICNERATQLLTHVEQLDVPLYVLWSGGIDSTLVLTSLIKNASESQRERIVVMLTENSIIENPRFFQDHILGKLKTDTRLNTAAVLGSKAFLTSGECNDQIFGSDLMFKMIERFGDTVLHQTYTRSQFFEHYDNAIHNETITNHFLDLFERNFLRAPIPLTSNFQFAWWINFALKWQTVYARMLTFVEQERAHEITPQYVHTYYDPFYNTEDFQLWALNNPEKRIKDEWRTYKWVCKDIIYDFTGDAEYRDNKIKSGSLIHLVKNSASFTFLDSEYKLYSELQPEEFYVPDNDFIL